MNISKNNKTDIYEELTNQMIEVLEKGDLTAWIRPWVRLGFPSNFASKTEYTGFTNLIMLAMKTDEFNFKYPLFATWNQINKLGGTVSKGAKSAKIIFFEFIEKDVEDKDDKKSYPVIRYFNVFNIEQTDLDVKEYLPQASDTEKEFKPIEAIEDFLAQVPFEIEYGGDKAYYSLTKDKIVVPDQSQFNESIDFYMTVLHELAHWSGASKRLARFTADATDKTAEEYSFEELVAEMTSMFVSAKLGLEPKLEHSGTYIKHWLELLKDSKYAMFKAASLAKKASDYLLSYQH